MNVASAGIKVGPFSMVDPFGTPNSQALHVMERYRLIDYEIAMQAQENGLKEWLYLQGVSE
jgi:hypothetical protein